MSNLVFFSLSDPTIAHCINQIELVPSELFPKHQNTFSQIWICWDKELANIPLKDISMERVRIEQFGESKDEDCGWVNLSRLEVLSFRAIASMTLQLPLHASHVCHSSDLPIARSSCKTPLDFTLLRFLHILSHTTLTWIPPKYRVSNCYITRKFGTK